ncbi:MAG: ABC transporter ATP-binding protein [Spirochaetales bacterium]|nr:ABC transporter ATP-binding protein [Spirochaetales bacterium]
MKLVLAAFKPHALAVFAVIGLVLARAMSELALPRVLGLIVDKGIALGDTAYILRMGAIMLGVNLVGMVCAFGSAYLSARVATDVGSSIRRNLFRRVTSFSPSDMDAFGASSLITRVTNDVGQVQNLSMMSLRLMVMAPLMMVGGIVMALSQDLRLSSVLIVALPLLAVMVAVFGRVSMPLFSSMQERTDGLARVVRENLSGLRVIRAFNRRQREETRFAKANADLAELGIRAGRLMGLLMPLMSLLLNVAVVAVLWMGAIRVNAGTVQVGSLLAFTQYLSQILFSLLMISMLFVMIPRAAVSVRRINEVMERQPGIRDDESACALPAGRDIVFSGVSMRYHGAEEPALLDVSFSCEPGEFVAIIGSTGAGKSTVLSLIMRFHEAETGSISLGGVDIRKLPQSGLRSLIGYVPQKTFLFSGTVASNVGYGGRQDQVADALDVAQAREFVDQLDGATEAVVERGGTNLSGGQRQRLAIARALARRPDIYLLDDSFSALDARTESRLRAAFKARAAGSVVIMATQRVRSAMHADKVIVLDEGRVVGIGTHEELTASNPVYRELAGTQNEEARHGA